MPPGPPRQRPPWWPEAEPWPPRGGPPWAGPDRTHRRFRRRVGCFVLAMAVVMASIGVLGLWLVANLIGLVADGAVGHPLVRAAAVVLLAAGAVTLLGGVRFASGLAEPVDELVEAAGRIESGDLSARVRVPERRAASRDLRHLAAAFNTMAARLESEEARRRRLLADLSHELRTPIAVIEGHLEAVLDGVYPADAAHLDPILDETRVLARIIDDLRTLSLAEAGVLALHVEAADLEHVIADVVAALRPRAETAGATVTTEVEPGLPELEVDSVRIHQVLANLLDNALRYTSAGGSVRIAARRVSEREVEVAVTDEGPGLAPELRATLFERFAKSADSPGSGLGLAIARAIVEAHGGRIRATAGSGDRGTRVSFTLPLNPDLGGGVSGEHGVR